MNRILITGASGFIGRHLPIALRNAGDEIHTVHKTARQMSDSRHHCVDLLDARQVDRLLQRLQPTHLVHLAWYTEHGKFWDSPANLDWVSASLHLFRSFVENGGQRALFAGSCAEYDWSHAPLNEETSPSNPHSLYGVCKNSLRQMIEKFSPIQVAWARLFFLYGPGESGDRLVPSILNPLLHDQPAIVRFGQHVRNLMHVQDAAAALAIILRSDIHGIVNVAGKDAVALGTAARLLGELAGKSHLLRIEDGEQTPQNPRLLIGDTIRLAGLGFVEKIPLRDGLAQLLADRVAEGL